MHAQGALRRDTSYCPAGPFVLLLKLGWRNGRAARDEEGRVVESEMCEVRISYKKYIKNEILPHSIILGICITKTSRSLGVMVVTDLRMV